EVLLMLWMRRRLGGYTGDCCGALFLFCELSVYLSFPLLFH
ncbi:MAG: adenosylcobinamide-GDP ribazoletransferase, partial [Bacteroidales bacterium]|nr:adenosylcobinamide-GDP ribazoletransferase [Bacteroidales bacterium]